MAARLGYHDQAHMIHDFRKLTGLTPLEYAARRTSVGVGFVPHVRVTVDYPMPFLTGFFGASIDLTGTGVMRCNG